MPCKPRISPCQGHSVHNVRISGEGQNPEDRADRPVPDERGRERHSLAVVPLQHQRPPPVRTRLRPCRAASAWRYRASLAGWRCGLNRLELPLSRWLALGPWNLELKELSQGLIAKVEPRAVVLY